MSKKDFYIILMLFIGWKILTLIFVFIAARFIPLQKDFLGGGMQNYLGNPYLWSWANFDGEHYISIARDGYLPLTYFFFPFYPLLMRFFALFFGNSIFGYLASGLFVSNISFFIGLIGFYKLIKIDFNRKISLMSIVLLLLFPTSFYFGAIYTEGLFFALVVWSFYFYRKENWILAGILAALATATRVVGLALVAGLLVEWWLRSTKRVVAVMSAILSLTGIGAYLYYLYVRTGNPLNFLTTISIFGPQRSSSLVLLPQVFYRYVFKILPHLDYSNFFVVFTPWLELIIAGGFSILAIYSFFKLRLSYSIYFLFGLLIPTLSGSFSSLPRYVLVLFPSFIVSGLLIGKLNHFLRILIYFLMAVLFIVCESFFVRGFWVS